jgi:ATP-binding cassette subfamily B protein
MTLRFEANLGSITSSWRETLRFIAILRRFRHHLRPQLGSILLATLASLGFTVVTLLEPWPLQFVFDGVLLQRPVHFLGWDLTPFASREPLLLLAGAAAGVLLLAVLRGQLYYVQNVRAATAGQDVVMAIRRELFEHLQTLSLSFHRRAHAGDLLMRLTGDIIMLREMVVAAAITLLTQGRWDQSRSSRHTLPKSTRSVGSERSTSEVSDPVCA